MKATTLEQTLTTEDAARILCCSPTTLATKRCRGGGPKYVKNGAQVVYLPSDIEAYLAENRRENTSQKPKK